MINKEELEKTLRYHVLDNKYPELEAVEYQYDFVNNFSLIFYLSRSPTAFDYEVLSLTMSEFISNYSYKEFENLKEECFLMCENTLEDLKGVIVYSTRIL